ncbi:hypothetical protein HYW74_00395 [Candidatus Pacearchaeota archaeon]|nr:hypothetical protein [Candidatus Pacearchaeota archaeon]
MKGHIINVTNGKYLVGKNKNNPQGIWSNIDNINQAVTYDKADGKAIRDYLNTSYGSKYNIEASFRKAW